MYREIDQHDVPIADVSRSIVRCCLGTVVDQLLAHSWHLKPGAVSPLPHLSTYLQLCQSVDNKEQLIRRVKLQKMYTIAVCENS